MPFVDVDSLLRSNDRPSEHQELYLLQRLSSLDGSLSVLDAERVRAQRALEELEFRQSKLLSKRKSIATIVSPYRRLPADVWIEIMKFAVWSRGLKSTTSNIYKPTTDDGRIHWPEPRQTCYLHSNILHGAAIFWCNLELHIYSNDHNIDGFAPRLETWLSRSGELPWSLKILSSKRQLHAPLFAAFLLRNCARWKELSLFMHDLDVLAPLFYLQPSSAGAGIPGCPGGGRSGCGCKGEHVWSNLRVLSLDGWFTDRARVRPFTLVDNVHADDADPLSLHHATICLHGTMPALKSLTIDTPCQKVNSWKWIPWAQLSDVDLRTSDQYEENISMLAKCSDALQTCSMVFAPSLRIPGPITQGIANLLVTGLHAAEASDDEGETSSSERRSTEATEVLHLGGLKELTLRKIGYLSPLISRLCAPALQKLFISMCPINEPEPYLGATLVDLLERSSAATSKTDEGDVAGWDAVHSTDRARIRAPSTSGPPLTYLTLALENTRRRRMSTPVITNGEYIDIFERTEKLRTLHLKDYSTDARFLEKINQRGLLPRLKTISFVVDADGQVPERFEEFVKLRDRDRHASSNSEIAE
ncbi:hypothetical protein FA13DRAFT_1732416 [Coprinellus micaceus]|uniref:Uncharacterized protein n=1 Tax=Coprinellus micaceus TaxID=71717 RepID=A0A4Y7TCA7_COPMI|nr:hypothetical protein FA13DRAFT_1732416 [Coprinellus micaceus]